MASASGEGGLATTPVCLAISIGTGAETEESNNDVLGKGGADLADAVCTRGPVHRATQEGPNYLRNATKAECVSAHSLQLPPAPRPSAENRTAPDGEA